MGRIFSDLYVQVSIVLFGCLFVFYRFFTTLPTVMQDEYVYLVQSVLQPLSENEFGNLLYAVLYGQVGIFGDEFYLAVKVINTFFLFGFSVGIIVLARKFLPKWTGTILGLTSVLSATSLYASVMMPEMMFYALSLWSIVLFTFGWESDGRKGPWYLASILLLVAAGLTKPHALILVLGLVVFVMAMLGAKRISRRSGATLAVGVLAGYSSLKLGIGYLLAGPAGLSLLGRNYERVLVDFFSDFIVGSSSALSASASGAAVAVGAGSTSASPQFFSILISQVILLAIVLCCVTFGLPLLLVSPLSKLTDFQALVISISSVFVFAIAAFTALVTLSGDDHSNRLLFRYFEFLIPLMLIAVFIQIQKGQQISSRRVILVASGLTVLATIWLLIIRDTGFRLSDSATLLGLFNYEFLPWIPIGAGALIMFQFLRGAKRALTWAVASSLIASSLIGVSAQQRQIDLNSEKIGADFAGDVLRKNFGEVPGSQILVVGTSKQLAFVTKFWSFKKGVEHIILQPGTGVSIEDPSLIGFSLAVELDQVLVIDGTVTAEGEGFRIISRRDSTE